MERQNDSSLLSSYWERFAIWIVGLLIAMGAWLFVDQKGRIDSIETKVQALQIDKVSRQELKDMEDRMGKRMDGMKGDIIDRIDWYFTGRRSKE